MNKVTFVLIPLTLFFVLLLLSGCGSDYASDAATTDTIVSGVASKGIIAGGTVRVFALGGGGSKGVLLAEVETDENGVYAANLGEYRGPVMIEAFGPYTDEATGEQRRITENAPLRAALASAEGAVVTAVTPLTELAVRRAEAAGLGPEGIEEANALLSDIFGLDIRKTRTVFVTREAIEAATQEQKAYALCLAAISQMTEDSGDTLEELLGALGRELVEEGKLSGNSLEEFDLGYANFLNSEQNDTDESAGNDRVGLSGKSVLVIAAKAALVFDDIKRANLAPYQIKTNLSLITTGASSTSISWSTSNADVIETDGTVTRSSFTTASASVVLTATITSNLETVTKQFNLVVPTLFTEAYVESQRLISFAKIYEGLARNPSMREDLLAASTRLAGDIDYSAGVIDDGVAAARMASFGAVYEGIARNPGMTEDLIALALDLTGPTGDPAGFSPKVQAARLTSFEDLYTGVMRNPGMKDELLAVVSRLAGDIDYSAGMIDDEVAAARVASFGAVYENIVRNPGMAEDLIQLALDLTGPTGDPAWFSPKVQAARLASFEKLYAAVARNPGMQDTLLDAATRLAGDIDYSSGVIDDRVAAARLASFGAVYESISRQPELAEELIQLAFDLTGPTGDPAGFSPKVQAARLTSFEKLYAAVARQPELKGMFLDAVTRLAGDIDYSAGVTDDEVAASRMASFGAVYESIARQPDLAEEFIALALDLTGPTGDPAGFSQKVQAARLNSFAKIYEGVARQPEMKGMLLAAASRMVGDIDYSAGVSNYEIAGARMASFGAVYMGIARQPEWAEALIQLALDLTGPTVE